MSAPQYGRTNKDNYSAAHKHKPSAFCPFLPLLLLLTLPLLHLTLPSLPVKCTLGKRDLGSEVPSDRAAGFAPYSCSVGFAEGMLD